MSHSNLSRNKSNIFFLLFLCHNLNVIIDITERGKSMADTQIVKKLVGLEPDLDIIKIEE